MIRFLVGVWLIVMAIGAAVSVLMACDDGDVKALFYF